MNVVDCKKKLRAVSDIQFNEPHFSIQLGLRAGDKEMVLAVLRNPDSLQEVIEQEGKYGDKKYLLVFEISSDRTMLLPVIFRNKSLYVLTYILRYRKWPK